MILTIDPDDRTPPYEQLRKQLINAITGGDLRPGTKLPTVRRLAADLGIAPNTVARTYLELDREGLIETRGRRGSFVADRDPAEHQQPAEAQHAADAYVQLIRRLDLDDNTALGLIRTALERS